MFLTRDMNHQAQAQRDLLLANAKARKPTDPAKEAFKRRERAFIQGYAKFVQEGETPEARQIARRGLERMTASFVRLYGERP